MKVVFYSEQCEYSKKLLAYLDKNNIKKLFKLVNIDKTKVPDNIDVVPTIIDTLLNQPMKGKKAFEYLLNLKFFNNPTNNIEYVKELPPNPNIQEDEKADKSNILNLELETTNTNTVSTNTILNDLFNVSKNVDNSVNNISNSSNSTDSTDLTDISDAKKFHDSTLNKPTNQLTQKMIIQRNIQDKKLAILMNMKMKRK
jgi:hypothetical protein